MVRQNLRERELSLILNPLSGKFLIDPLTDLLIERGFIPGDDPSAYREWQKNQARKLLQQNRKQRRRAKETQHEFISLYEVHEDGTKVQYWRKQGELTKDEAIQDLQYCFKHSRYWAKEFHHKLKFHVKRFGKRFQRELPFPIPELVNGEVAGVP